MLFSWLNTFLMCGCVGVLVSVCVKERVNYILAFKKKE